MNNKRTPAQVSGTLGPLVRPCRHNRCWLVAGGHIAWCYECGAIRKLAAVKGGINAVAPVGCWVKPTGRGGANPWTVRFDGPNSSISLTSENAQAKQKGENSK